MFEKAKIEIVKMNVQDIITTSTGSTGPTCDGIDTNTPVSCSPFNL